MTGVDERASLRALLLATLAFFTCFYVWALFGPLSPAIQHDLGLSEVELGWLVAIPVVLGSLMRIPMGVLTDRYGARTTFPLLMGFTSLPLLAIAGWHGSFLVLIVLGCLLGPFVLGAVLVLVVGAGFWALSVDPPGPRPVVTSLAAPFKVFRTDVRAWALTLFYFLAFGGFVAMFLYLPKLLVGVHQLTRADAGARAAGFALLAVLARPLGGYLSDRYGARRVLIVSFGGTAILATGLTFGYASMVPLTICCLSMAVMFGLGTGAVFKLVAAEYPAQVGAVTGVVGAAGGLGGFFPPLVMASVKSITGSYTLGFALLALTAAACLLIAWNMRRPQPAGVPESAESRFSR